MSEFHGKGFAKVPSDNPRQRAVDHVDFDIRRGDVHALNGGKWGGDQVSFSSHLQNKTSSKT